ncbi:MAG: hypothetical protein AAGF86_07370, partial [Pseudomonadota bacterium]
MLLFSAQSADAAQARACAEALIKSATQQMGTARDVADGPIVLMAGDTKVRLAGLTIPAPPRDPKRVIAVESAAAAKAHLTSLIMGPVLLAAPGFRKDRRGRDVVQLVVAGEGEGGPIWVQAEMVRAGHARVWPSRRGNAC